MPFTSAKIVPRGTKRAELLQMLPNVNWLSVCKCFVIFAFSN